MSRTSDRLRRAVWRLGSASLDEWAEPLDEQADIDIDDAALVVELALDRMGEQAGSLLGDQELVAPCLLWQKPTTPSISLWRGYSIHG
jgi:hypothetical protein